MAPGARRPTGTGRITEPAVAAPWGHFTARSDYSAIPVSSDFVMIPEKYQFRVLSKYKVIIYIDIKKTVSPVCWPVGRTRYN